jgi:hypothetical protein
MDAYLGLDARPPALRLGGRPVAALSSGRRLGAARRRALSRLPALTTLNGGVNAVLTLVSEMAKRK